MPTGHHKLFPEHNTYGISILRKGLLMKAHTPRASIYDSANETHKHRGINRRREKKA
jgi:hypothetical protein